MVRTERPKAKDTPSNPIPTCGKAAASTALPHPPSTSQRVPKNSAEAFCIRLNSFMNHLFRGLRPETASRLAGEFLKHLFQRAVNHFFYVFGVTKHVAAW